MLEKIKGFFARELSLSNTAEEQQGKRQQSLQLAAAALLIELSRADYSQDSDEQQAIERALKKCFDLDASQIQELVELAEEENKQATSLYQFTNLIKDNYDAEQRFELIKMLWKVAIADGEISKYEDYMIRKVADLIYLPHSQFIRAKLEVIR